ncbi:MAG: hypothetical protein PHU85_09690 [Phycisphaerae bacterium]|nr:hypothetical protein [Phycisphaerae bacterium]
MFARMLKSAVAVLAIGAVLLAAPQPGERAKGPEFKADGFTLVWGKLKTTADVELGDVAKSRYSLQMDGSIEAPADMDVVAVFKKLRIRSIADAKGADMSVKSGTGTAGGPMVSSFGAYNAIHRNVGQVELPRTELAKDATLIGTLGLETDVVIAKKREEVRLPAIVMEDFKDVGQGVSIRIRSLTMSTARELTVALDYKRLDSTPTVPFIEQVFAMDPLGKDLGGGRWTEGDPMGKTGTWTSKFTLAGTQVHQSFRFLLVTQSDVKRLSFDVKDMFNRGEPIKKSAGGTGNSTTTPPIGPIQLP